jgi:hypothetical protein
MSVRVGVILTSLMLVAACSTTPRPAIIAALRTDPAVVAECSGSPVPSFIECRDNGEQALEELGEAGIEASSVLINFGSVGSDGCREAVWEVRQPGRPAVTATSTTCPPP